MQPAYFMAGPQGEGTVMPYGIYGGPYPTQAMLGYAGTPAGLSAYQPTFVGPAANMAYPAPGYQQQAPQMQQQVPQAGGEGGQQRALQQGYGGGGGGGMAGPGAKGGGMRGRPDGPPRY